MVLEIQKNEKHEKESDFLEKISEIVVICKVKIKVIITVEMACVGHRSNLSCPEGQVIHIMSGVFGRLVGNQLFAMKYSKFWLDI